MKTVAGGTHRERGYSLIEIMVAMMVAGFVLAVVLLVGNAGTILFAKNVAVNTAHTQIRSGMHRMIQDLHLSVSTPRLLNGSLNTVTPTVVSGAVPPAEGISYRVYAGGPCRLNNDVAQGATVVKVDLRSKNDAITYTPVIGDSVLIPTHSVDAVISGISGASTNVQLTLATAVPVAITGSQVAGATISVHFTRRVAYAVLGGELRYFPNLSGDPNAVEVVARGVTSATPFSFPVNASTGEPDTTRVDVTFSTQDTEHSVIRRINSAAPMLVNSSVATRYLLSGGQ